MVGGGDRRVPEVGGRPRDQGHSARHGLDGGARAVLDGPQPIPFQVWSPASSAYRDTFEREWRAKHANQPILKGENLALTPMVFVMWETAMKHSSKKYSRPQFQTVAAGHARAGRLGNDRPQPDWGRFKFGHTHPKRSNSGLLTLVLMAYEFAKKERNLSHDDVADAGFQKWLRAFRAGRRPARRHRSHSTGTLMREMVLRGPSQYDCVIVYENLAIDYLDEARDRWGELRVDYPEPNMWNEHPYYILDVPWSDSRQRAAAAEFLKFLMSEPIQRNALEHGFRPGNHGRLGAISREPVAPTRQERAADRAAADVRAPEIRSAARSSDFVSAD